MKIENVKENVPYKNYKVLCDLLEEPQKTNRTLQLKDWARYFSFHKEGNKYVIDKIYDVPLEKKDGRVNNGGAHNTKNLDIMIPVLRKTLNEKKCYGKAHNITDMLCSVLGLFNEEICCKVYQSDTALKKYLKEFKIKNTYMVRDYVSIARQFTKRLLYQGLEHLAKTDDFEYSRGYYFTFQLNKRHKGHIFSDDLNEEIIEIETETCNEINEEFKISDKMKGRQLLFTIYGDMGYTETYSFEKINKLMEHTQYIEKINSSPYKEDSGLISEISEKNPLLYYTEAIYIGSVCPENCDCSITLDDLCNLVAEKTRKGLFSKYYISKKTGNRHFKYHHGEIIEEMLELEKLLYMKKITVPLEGKFERNFILQSKKTAELFR